MSDNFVRYGNNDNLADQIFKLCEKNNIKVVKNYDTKIANYSFNVQSYYEPISEELIENIIELIRKYDNL